jgi:hypothetical protein
VGWEVAVNAHLIPRTADAYYPVGRHEEVPTDAEIVSYCTPTVKSTYVVRHKDTGKILGIYAYKHDVLRAGAVLCGHPWELCVGLDWRSAYMRSKQQDAETNPRTGTGFVIVPQLPRVPERHRARLARWHEAVLEYVEEHQGCTLDEVADALAADSRIGKPATLRLRLYGSLQRKTIPGVRAEWNEDGSVGRVWLREE